MIGGVAAVVLGIMALAGFLGWLKLRRRDVATLLEACGWALNVRIYLSRRHSLRFTRVPPLPQGASRERTLIGTPDSDEGEGSPLGVALFVFLGVALVVGIAFSENIITFFSDVFGRG
jgi:hypothetical protein